MYDNRIKNDSNFIEIPAFKNQEIQCSKVQIIIAYSF